MSMNLAALRVICSALTVTKRGYLPSRAVIWSRAICTTCMEALHAASRPSCYYTEVSVMHIHTFRLECKAIKEHRPSCSTKPSHCINMISTTSHHSDTAYLSSTIGRTTFLPPLGSRFHHLSTDQIHKQAQRGNIHFSLVTTLTEINLARLSRQITVLDVRNDVVE